MANSIKRRTRARLLQKMARRSSNTCLGTLYFLFGRRKLTRYCLIHPLIQWEVILGGSGWTPRSKHSFHVVLHELGNLHHHEFRGWL